jgi:hypothetical protein
MPLAQMFSMANKERKLKKNILTITGRAVLESPGNIKTDWKKSYYCVYASGKTTLIIKSWNFVASSQIIP